MGALAPISPWIPDDDLLLKNAVEAGASLESLAKGAVQFSRRFTIQELRDRWHSLLYDPEISAVASTHLVQLELSASNISSQSNRLGHSKGTGVPRKRKSESVRSLYYAMRKRICNEPFNSVDLSFLNAPNLRNCTGEGGGCEEQLTIHNEHPVGNCILGDHITNHFDLQDMDFDIIHHGFRQVGRTETAVGGGGVTNNAFHTGHQDSLEGNIPDGIVGRDCLYGYAENVSPVSVNEPVGNDDLGHTFDNVHKDNSHIIRENLTAFGSNSGIHEMGQPQTLPVGNLFETDDLKTKTMSVFDSINNNPGIVSSGFGSSQGFSSPISDCSAPFHQLGYSSPMPIWRTIEDIPTPAIPIDENPVVKDKNSGDTLALTADNSKKMSSSGYDAVHSEAQLKDGASGDGLCSSTPISEGDLLDLSNSLLNFTNEEVLLFMDVDGKDMMSRSCLDGLNSILLNSPNDVHQDDKPSTSEPKASVALDTCLMFPDVACSGELDVIVDKLHSDHNVCDSEVIVPPSKSAPNPHSPELRNGFICCTLNTEDPDIPCNDDAFASTQVFPLFASSEKQPNSEDAAKSLPPSTKDFSDDRKVSKHGQKLVKEEGQAMESQVLQEMCSNNPIKIFGVKSELPESTSLAVSSRHAGAAGGDPSLCRSVSLTPHSLPAGIRKDDVKKVECCDFENSINFLIERPVHGSENHPQIVVDCCKQEADVSVDIQNHVSTLSAPCSIEMAYPEPAVNPSTSDHEEQLSENDDAVPYFSDIEAMILDMDLGPCNQDSYFSREVSRYQYEDTKRAIIRLEQGAHSYMQRAIAHHRAFAILYGRHLKYYIKKPEVLLGRATDDVNVDIDLAREGHANKISRRQAIIKMEEDGSFCLKNLGKSSILINSKEVTSGQHLRLSPSCLIEMRGMRFVFETNLNFVKQYLANKAKRNQDMSSKFEWSPNGAQ